MNRIIIDAQIAPHAGGFGLRLFAKSMAGTMPGVWAGMGWKQGDEVPTGATATMSGGFIWTDKNDAEAFKRDVLWMQERGTQC